LQALQTKNRKNGGEKIGDFRVPHSLNYPKAKKEEIVTLD
jgi:hypothetical protein